MRKRAFRNRRFAGVTVVTQFHDDRLIVLFSSPIYPGSPMAGAEAIRRVARAEFHFSLQYVEPHRLDVTDNTEPVIVDVGDGTQAVELIAMYEPCLVHPPTAVADCRAAVDAASIAPL